MVATSASSLLGVWGGDQDQHHYGHYGHEYTGRMIRTSTIRGRGGVVFSHRPAPYYVPEDLISLLDAGISADHPSVIIDADAMFNEDFFG